MLTRDDKGRFVKGIPYNKIIFNNQQKQEIIHLYSKGYGCARIGKIYGCSEEPIRKLLKESKIKLRSFAEAIKSSYDAGLITIWSKGLDKNTHPSLKKISEDRKGEKNWMYHKNFSKEHRERLTEAGKLKWARWKKESPEIIEKFRNNFRGNKLRCGLNLSEKHKQKNRETMNKIWNNPSERKKREKILYMANNKKSRKDKISKHSLKMWQDESYKNKQKEKSIRLSNDEKYKNKLRIASIKMWKNPDHRKKMEPHMKRVITILKEYRKINVLPKKDTSIEIKIQNYLQQLGYEFFTHKYIKEIEHGYQCDILIPVMNLVIECDGDYWHSYPTGREIDHIRTKELLEKGFKVLRLWECEIRKLNIEEFKDKLESI